jgi:glyoxylase-like metal-dependent hydrolase (beta-lactamase superfamily II)
MIRVSNFGPVTRFDLSRSFAGRGIYWTTAYLVDGLLVDTGCAFTALELLEKLTGTSIDQIINTHSHEDHIGANAHLAAQYPKVKILAHPFALPILAQPHIKQPLHLYRRLVWGMPSPSEAQPLHNGSLIKTENYQFQVVYTPGHTSDHLCLYEPDQGWIFTGDLFVGGRDRAIRAGSDIWQIIDSLKLIAALPLDAMYPGSARTRHKPAEDLIAKINYLERLGEEIFSLKKQGYSIPGISRLLLGGPMWIELITLGHLSRQNLVRSYLTERAGE